MEWARWLASAGVIGMIAIAALIVADALVQLRPPGTRFGSVGILWSESSATAQLGFPMSLEHMSSRELARFGHLFLNRGKWKDRQLVSASWADQATSVQVLTVISHDA